MKGTLNLYWIFMFLCLSACQGNRKYVPNLPDDISVDSMKTIDVKISDKVYDHLDQWLEADKYIKLPSDPLIAEIRDIHIENDRIFVHDKLHQMACYDINGNFLWKIDALGAGPGEYVGINDFMVKKKKKEIVLYDNLGQKLLYYSIQNGEFIRSKRLREPNPTDMAYKDGTYFYDNRFHNNYPEEESLHYSLLTSHDGIHVVQGFFNHDENETAIRLSAPKKFYYSDSLLLYCRDFDNKVFQISEDGIKARYQINLPDPLPSSYIEKGVLDREMLERDYSSWLCNIYECGRLLYFCYSYGDAFMVSLYDLYKHELIYSGRRMEGQPDSKLPLYLQIDGVYKGQFFGILTPEFIDWVNQDQEGKYYPDILKGFNSEEDNPVIVFFNTIAR